MLILSATGSSLWLISLILVTNVCANEIKTDTASDQDFEELGLHYGKYLKEVVAALDKDQKFTETIKNMDANDIKSGKVAEQLKHVHEDVRKKLNDLKYLEIKRLRDLATRKNEMEQYGETYHGTDKRKWRTLGASLSQLPDHLGSHGNHFDMNDLHKLMVAATNDLEKLDKERREDYKTYEMEKEWQFQERLKMMNETEKQEAIKLRQKLKEKHDDHPKVHEPGTKQQFEEVWEKKDHLPKQEFDPKTFFSLHDLNSDNYWDQYEVRKTLEIQVSKIYDPDNPEDDPNEMEEEIERMREHVFKEIDADKDGLISLQEFLDYSKKPEFRQDHGWDSVGKQDAYSQKDYEDYMKHREQRMKEMHGHYDPSIYANQPSNLHLPNWGLGMPAGVHPGQYYGYNVDPHHQQMLAAQQAAYAGHGQAAYQHPQAAYQQPGIAQQPQAAYQQPQVAYQQPGIAQQPQAAYQQPGVVQQPQAAYQQPGVVQQPQAAYQQPGVVQQPQAGQQYHQQPQMQQQNPQQPQQQNPQFQQQNQQQFQQQKPPVQQQAAQPQVASKSP